MTSRELAKFRSKYLREGYRKAVKNMKQINEANNMATAEQVDEFVDKVSFLSSRINEICQMQWIAVAYNPIVKELKEIYQSSIVQSSPAMSKLVNIRKKIKMGQPLTDRNLQAAKAAIDEVAPAVKKAIGLAEKAYKLIYDSSLETLNKYAKSLKSFF